LRLLFGALVAATLYVGWFQGRTWESGWLPPLAALWVLLWLYSWRLGLIVTVVGALGILVRDPRLLSGIAAAEEYSINTRLVAWEILLQNIIPLNPILGLGPANYYYYTRLFAISGYFVSFNSHSQYVDILAQTGIVGLLTFSWLMAAIARLGWRLRRTAKVGFERAYVYACLAGLAGSLCAGVFGDWFLPFVYNIGLTGFRASVLGWLFLGGLVAVDRFTYRRLQDATTE
jgi:O-antigen ligase